MLKMNATESVENKDLNPDVAWHKRLCLNDKYMADINEISQSTKTRIDEIEKNKYRVNCETNVITIPTSQPELTIPPSYNNMLVNMGLPPITMVNEEPTPWILLLLIAAILIGVILYFKFGRPIQPVTLKISKPAYPGGPVVPDYQPADAY